MNSIKIIFTFVLSAYVFHVQAQEIEPEVFIKKKNTQKIELPQANRNYDKINFELQQPATKPLEYQPEEVAVDVPKLPTKVNVAMDNKRPSLPKLYGNYVKVGFGNYNTPYLEGFFNNKRSENLSYGVHLRHLSSANGPVKYSGVSENKAKAYVKYFTKTFEFNSGLSYERDRLNFYGFNQALPVERDTLKQVFNTIAFNAGIKGLNKDSKFNYDTRFSYYNFRDHYNAKEDEFLTSFYGGFRIDSEKMIRTDAVLSISNYKDSAKFNRNYFQIKPALFYDLGKYKITGGFNVAYSSDTVNTSKLHLYPRVHVDVELIENKVAAFAGLHGELEKNTFRSFASQNPFLQPDLLLLHSNKALEFYTGIHGNHNGLNFKAKLAYANYKNLFFFNNSKRDSSAFEILYDRAPSVLNLEGDVSYDVAETFRLGLNLNYYNYSMSTLEKAWHRPGFTTSFTVCYNLKQKIYINTNIYYLSGLTGKNYISNREVKLDGILDANLKIEYNISNVFSAYLEFNNILSKKYQRYLYYPVKGINVIGGISYSF